MTISDPDNIWITPDGSGAPWEWQGGWWNGRKSENYTVKYTRADLYDPLRDERVRALVEALEAVVFAAEAHDETGDMMQEHWLDDARAALRGIKEPAEHKP